jgi:CYTH domain-containing protein
MTSIAVRYGDELNGITELRKQDGRAAGILVAIIGMSPDHDNTDLIVVLRKECGKRKRYRNKEAE